MYVLATLVEISTDTLTHTHTHTTVGIGVDLAGLLGGRMASAEGGSRVERGGIWGGVSPLQPTKGSGGASSKTRFWRILKAAERSFLYLTKTGGGTICISAPRSKFWGGDLSPLSPRDLRP